MNYLLSAYALQDIGKRTVQEDYFYPSFLNPCPYEAAGREWAFFEGTSRVDDRFFLVCDGMGGHDRGEVASRTVVHSMSQYIRQHASVDGAFPDELVYDAVQQGLEALAAKEDPNEVRKMGTTMALLKFHEAGATIAHIGDSRVYQFRPAQKGLPAKICFHTEDHTVVNDLLVQGKITMDNKQYSNQKHLLSRVMVSNRAYCSDVEINHLTDIRPGDLFLLCSDGLLENLTDEQLCQWVCDPNVGDAERVQNLLQVTLDNEDNHTAIVIRVQQVYNGPEEIRTEETLQPGTIICSPNYSYHIEKKLGQGAFGITYLVNTTVSMCGSLGTIQTAVKMVLKEFFMHNEMKRLGTLVQEESKTENVRRFALKFRNEAAKLALFNHPHIVNVLEVFEANNTIYYAMEYLPGGNLGDYVNQHHGLPEKEAIWCILQIASALEYLHAGKVLHLDMKPFNVMLADGIENLKIIDFGLALRYQENGEPEKGSTLGCGTPGYAPLEQADPGRNAVFSPQMDVYALGATYYKILTGEAPDLAIDVLHNGVQILPLIRKNVTKKTISAIMAAMEPSVEKRPASVQEFVQLLPRLDDEESFRGYHYRLWHRFLAWCHEWI